jgi:hypothetical protein
MPSGVFPVPKFRSAPDRGDDRISFAVRLRTRFRRNRLDAELAQGGDPSASAELTFRATQLRSPGERARLANTLIKALRSARGPNLGAFTRKAQRRDAAVRQSADDLLALALRLRDDRPIDVAGVAMTARLANDRATALHRGPAHELQAATHAARLALDNTTASAHEDLPAAA